MKTGPKPIAVLRHTPALFNESLSRRAAAGILFFILAGFAFNVKAQDVHLIDSLQKELKIAGEDSNKTRLYYRIWQQYRNNDMELAASYARKGLAHAQKIKWNKGVAAFYTSIGEGFQNLQESDSALYYYNRAIAIYQKIDFPKGLAGAYNNISAVYGNSSDFVKAIEYSFKGLAIVLDIKDTSYASMIYNNIGKYFYNQQNYPKAKEYTFKALNMAETAGLPEHTGDSYSQLAMIYLAQKDSAQSASYYERAIRIFEATQNLVRLAETYSNLSASVNSYPEKLAYGFKARNLFDSLQLSTHLVSIANYGNIGVDYFDLVRFRDRIKAKRGGIIPVSDKELLALAEQYLKKSVSLSRETEAVDNLYHFLKVLGELEEYKGNAEKALAYYKESYMLGDSLFSQENKNKIAALESQRAIDQRDKQLAINGLELDNARRTRFALIAGAALLFVIGGLLFYQNRTRRKTNKALVQLNRELDEANKIKTRFFGILSHDLRSPVANLVHFLHLQQEAPDLLGEESVKSRQQKLAISAEQLLETMESILLWSKSQMEHFVPQKKQLKVNELFASLEKQIPPDNDIAIIYDAPDDLWVETDEHYIGAIMYNLQANAVKALIFTANPKLEWKAYKENGKVTLSITDNGPGISKEQADVLYNQDAIVSTKQGLGLHIIRDLARAIDCRIVVMDDQNSGSHIKLIL